MFSFIFFYWFSMVQWQMVLENMREVSLQKAVPFQWLYKMMCSTPVLYWTNIPEKHGKAWRPGVEGPVVGGNPCRPPKMHQISNEVVRDWSLLGSWYFCLFLMISRDLFWIFLERSQKLLLSTLVWMMLCNSYICISYSYVVLVTLSVPNLPLHTKL